MDSKKYLDDISEIKNMMQKSSRFMSLSGLSGILAGIYALVGAYIAHNIITNVKNESNSVSCVFKAINTTSYLFTIAIIVVVLAIATGIFLSYRKSKKNGEKLWDVSSKRLLLNFSLPLVVGGLFCIILIQRNFLSLVAPSTLIFYGLACVNASKYTLGYVLYLGITNIIIGLIATQFSGYSLYFWALGFGICHIIYGSLIYFKHDKN